jgi:hypothetical protein
LTKQVYYCIIYKEYYFEEKKRKQFDFKFIKNSTFNFILNVRKNICAVFSATFEAGVVATQRPITYLKHQLHKKH